jgi:ferritin-like metal-binding protein YciE
VTETPQPPRVDDARTLLTDELAKLLSVEEALARTILPKLRQEAQDEQLQQALGEHLEQTRAHVENVKNAFGHLGESPRGADAKGLDGLKQEREATVAGLAPSLRDGFNASAAMGGEHYEIASYETAIRLAEALGLDDVGAVLRANLREEVDALERLAQHATRLARQAAEQAAVA